MDTAYHVAGKIDSDKHTMIDFFNLADTDLFAKTKLLTEYVEDWKHKGTYLYRRCLTSGCEHRVVVDDEFLGIKREMVMMASNNYLGLSTHPRVIEAAGKALRKYGSGISGSPLLNGTFDMLAELEAKLAQLKGGEDAMVFTTGYSANVGAISGIIRPGDIIIIDRLNHASIIDGCKLAGGKFIVFKHNDMESLEGVLKKCSGKFMGKLIVTDGIFSMDGDLARLPRIVELARRYGAKVMVDDAHATGVIGEHGGGTTDHFHLKGAVDMVMGTLSKSIGATGGFVVSNKETINYLRHYSRSYIFSTGLTPPVIASAVEAINIIEDEPELRQALWDNIHYMHDNLKALGYDVFPSPPESPVMIILIRDEVKLRQMSRRIHERGVFLNAVPYPAVPRDECRFRISLMATHTKQDMDETLDVLRDVGKEFGVI